MAGSDGLTFRCYSCSRCFHWRDDLPGRTIRCTCGVKFRCPDLTAENRVAQESLEDTVTDVDLNEAFDHIEVPGEESAQQYEVGPVAVAPRGAFGLSAAAETLLWGIGMIIGVAFGLLAIIIGEWLYIVCAVVLSICVLKFRRSWRNWTRGRPWMECMMEALGERESA